MKLTINFDFINAVLNVNEKFGPLKIVRNNKKLIGAYYFPFFTIIDYTIYKDLKYIIQELIIQFGFVIGSELIAHLLTNADIYKNKSINDLKKLVISLKQLNLNTSYDLLLSSTLYGKDYKISFNKDNLLQILESKYILVPTNGFNGNIKEVSILQEHNVGSNTYVLSIGSKKKEYSLAYNSN